MALLSLSNIEKSYADRKILENISFTIEQKHKIGLVGINGSGKTTLFKIIQNQVKQDAGEIYKSKNTVIGYVEQFTCSDNNKTVYEEVLSINKELIEIENKINEIHQKLAIQNENIESLLEEQRKKEEEYKNLGGYTYKSITKSTIIGLGFKEEELNQKMDKLSGGQKTKVMLAKMLISKSNLLLLDEPTNNLDIDSIEWLEEFLLNYQGSYVVISHDRYFLDKVTKETFELEYKKLSIYNGNYSKYINLKSEQNKALAKKYEGTQKEIGRIEGIIAQQKTWSQERNYKIIKSKQKIIDRLEEGLEKPKTETEKMKFRFSIIEGGNKEVLEIENLAKSFGTKQIFKNINMEILKKEKVFIVGPNGCGKTTLLKIIQNQIKQDDGNYKIGGNIKIAYYSQTGEELTENKTILKYIWDKHTELNQTEVRKALAIFLFKGEDVEKNIQNLSGGEKARIELLLIMLSKSNFLILDEPTNHLDINAREALENALLEYEGTMLIVSHDRYFINKLANKVYKIEKEGAKEYKGNYDDYISQYKEKKEEKIEKASENKIAYLEKKAQESKIRKAENRIKKLEEEIEKTESKIKELEELSQKEEYGTDYQKAIEITNEITKSKENLEKMYEEWEELQNSK